MKKGLIVLAIASTIAVGGGVTYACISKYNEVSHQIEVNEGEESKIEELLKKFKETYLVPLVAGGISFTTIISAVGVVITVVQKKKTNSQLVDVEKNLENANKIYDEIKALVSSLKDSNEFNQAVKDKLQTAILELTELVKGNDEINRSVERLNAIIKTLCELEAKVATLNDKAISSGILEDISKLKAQLSAKE